MNMKYWLGENYINATIGRIENILEKYAVKNEMLYTVLPPTPIDENFEVWLMFTSEHEGVDPYLLAHIADALRENNLIMDSVKFGNSAVSAYIKLKVTQ